MKTLNKPAAGHPVVSRDKWLAARTALLAKEKELTRQRDRVTAERLALPWVKVEKPYTFGGPRGKETLADLFGPHSQLLVYHFMFGPDWEEGCPNCSYLCDHFDGPLPHLAARDITFVAVSRAPLPKIDAFKRRMGWLFNWYSSYGTDFNHDFQVSATREELDQGRVPYNYTIGPFNTEEMPGLSAFYKDAAGDVFHTYSTYSRGLDWIVGTYHLLDLAPKGRDEEGLAFSMAWVRYHDRYGPDYGVDPQAHYVPPKGALCPHCEESQS